MKKIILSTMIVFYAISSFSQTFNSPYLIKKECDFKNEFKDRTIIISDKEISISNFIDGGVKTLYLVINKKEEKEYSFDGMCTYFYCTTKDKDPINGTQKAIVIKKYDTLYLGLFASEIDVYNYQFSIKR
jgi:hypothetical protein